MKHSQLSLEFMLVLAASASFLLVLLPVYAQAQEKTRETVIDQIQLSAFKRIVGFAMQTETLGIQSELTAEIRFAAETTLSFNPETQTIEMAYARAGENKSLKEKLGFDVELNQTKFGKGEFQTVFKNAGIVEISLNSKE